MRSHILKFMAGVCALFALAACQDEPRKAEVHISPDGHTFHYIGFTDKDVTDTTIMFAWPTNWAFDGALNPAVPVVGERVISSGGTAELAPQEVLSTFEDLNAQASLSLGPDVLYAQISFPRESRDQAIAIGAELLAEPQFDPRWIERHIAAVAEAAQANSIDPSQTGWIEARKLLLADAPLARSLSLLDPALALAVSEEELRDWHQRSFTQKPIAISVAGESSVEEAGKAVDQLLAGLPLGEEVAVPEVALDWSQTKLVVDEPNATQSTIGFLGQLPSTADGLDHLDYLLAHFLAGTEGILFKEVREGLRASYGLTVGFANYDRATRLFYIYGEVDPAQIDAVEQAVRESYESFRTAPDLTRMKELQTQIADNMSENSEYVDVAARQLREIAIDGVSIEKATNLPDVMRSITEDDLRQRLKEAFPAGDELLVIHSLGLAENPPQTSE